ncbi:MAG TPA: tRNA 5-methoxyuridine(34)/uridine 5-oxyacetic acid(34) synthase CmoB [Thiotrichales bacterium]|nr:tRNA 5-methoxyuridine(34)/uridine 5-oxyacetic acid(34) synthase CmoB [Thiotrichales bacterium]
MNPAFLDYRPLFSRLRELDQGGRISSMSKLVQKRLSPAAHGDFERWAAALARLPEIEPSSVDLSRPCIRIGTDDDAGARERETLREALMALHPWRKGPFEFFGVQVDAEWRSDWKWARLEPHITPLKDRRVLDVGCGNGYYAWRMAGAGAALVLGVDPTLLYVMQYAAARRYLGDRGVFVLPLALEDVPEKIELFDTVFSMGVLYHRRSPFDHLLRLRDALRPGGELVLETLVIEGGRGRVLVPEGRYARMRNVWFIPSVPELTSWLERAGFRQVRVVDVTATTTEEQRSTEWMRFESLDKCLDPTDPGRTVEGHPAPLRAILIAERPT